MTVALPARSVRNLLHPSEANIACAASWALEVDRGIAAQAVVISDFADLAELLQLDGTLAIWYGAPSSDDIEPLLPLLPPHEREEIARYRLAGDRWSVAAARASARLQLSSLLNCSSDQVAIVRSSLGKPSLDPAVHGSAADTIHFNISHTRGLVAVAVATQRVGIDVEAVRALRDMEGIAETVFATEALRDLNNTAPLSERIATFYRLWSLGEAFIKATGEGISQDLLSFAFTASGAPRLTRVDGAWGPAERWSFGTSYVAGLVG